MSSKIKFIIIFAAILTFTAESAFCYWIWTPETKKWVNPKYAPKATPKEQLLYALDFFEAKEYKRALTEFKKIIKYYKRSEAASEAQYYIGRCYENLGNPYHAFEAYQKRDWKNAVSLYKKVLKLQPGDTVAELFIRRCEHLQKDPPSDDWDGVWRFEHK